MELLKAAGLVIGIETVLTGQLIPLTRVDPVQQLPQTA